MHKSKRPTKSQPRSGKGDHSKGKPLAQRAKSNHCGSATDSKEKVEPDESILREQQALLNHISDAFSDALEDPAAVLARVQTIKTQFFNRDFVAIFSDPQNLPAYSARYLPSRALAYVDLFRHVPELQQALIARDPLHAVVLGGGAGPETTALLHCRYGQRNTGSDSDEPPVTRVTVADMGDYGSVLHQLEISLAHAYAIGEPLLHEGTGDGCDSQCQYGAHLTTDFRVANLLDADAFRAVPLASADLVTLCFVLNELCAQAKAGAVRLLQALRTRMRPGALLLVVDSAGSFSEIPIGKNTYKITILMDMLPGLQRIAHDDSRWFRVPQDLRYPLKLENMRYFYRLYRIEDRT